MPSKEPITEDTPWYVVGDSPHRVNGVSCLPGDVVQYAGEVKPGSNLTRVDGPTGRAHAKEPEPEVRITSADKRPVPRRAASRNDPGPSADLGVI